MYYFNRTNRTTISTISEISMHLLSCVKLKGDVGKSTNLNGESAKRYKIQKKSFNLSSRHHFAKFFFYHVAFVSNLKK